MGSKEFSTAHLYGLRARVRSSAHFFFKERHFTPTFLSQRWGPNGACARAQRLILDCSHFSVRRCCSPLVYLHRGRWSSSHMLESLLYNAPHVHFPATDNFTRCIAFLFIRPCITSICEPVRLPQIDLSLSLRWVALRLHAHRFFVCLHAVKNSNDREIHPFFLLIRLQLSLHPSTAIFSICGSL